MPDLITFGPSIRDAYNGSYLTFGTADADAQATADNLAEQMSVRGVGRPSTAILVTGAEINTFAESRSGGFNLAYTLDETARYIMFPLTGLNSGQLVTFKVSTGGRWFDDMINNMTSTFE